MIKIGIATAISFPFWDIEKTFAHVSKLGYETLEIGAGGLVSACHLPGGKLESALEDGRKVNEYKKILDKCNLKISALSYYDNHLHPNLEKRRIINDQFKKVIEVASVLEVPIVVAWPGCPFDWGRWYPFPPENVTIYEKGWKEAAETWRPILDFAAERNVKIASEVHPGNIAYNFTTLKKMLNEIQHKALGVNYDPSHLIWQGIDPVIPIYAFSKLIWHAHAKDTEICPQWVSTVSLLATGTAQELSWKGIGRGWRFRIPGWGNINWKRVISSLVEVGYDNVLSLEHEDAVMSAEDGAEKFIQFVKPLIIKKPGEEWWER